MVKKQLSAVDIISRADQEFQSKINPNEYDDPPITK
jgi:hypothetical protein